MRGCPVRDLLWQQVRKRSAGPVGCRQGAQGGLQDRRGGPGGFTVSRLAVSRVPEAFPGSRQRDGSFANPEH
jgi:hypothetical protein